MPIEARTIFCDDIRREDNGKFIFIGVYADDLIPLIIPSTRPLSLWIEFHGIPEGTHKLDISVVFPGGDELNLPGDIEIVSPDAPARLMIVGFPATIKQPGIMTVVAKLLETEVKAGSLIVRPPTIQNAPAPA